MTAESTTIIKVSITSHDAAIISSALKYAGDMQKKYSVASPNCFEAVHKQWNSMLSKVGNDILFGVHLPDESTPQSDSTASTTRENPKSDELPKVR